jgi:hypothetical protein
MLDEIDKIGFIFFSVGASSIVEYGIWGLPSPGGGVPRLNVEIR